jgi:hypothetical protein
MEPVGLNTSNLAGSASPVLVVLAGGLLSFWQDERITEEAIAVVTMPVSLINLLRLMPVY